MKNSIKSTITTLALLTTLLVFVTTKTQAQVTNYKAYALYVYNFGKYTTWPDSVDDSSFIITVVGNSRITPELEKMATTRTIHGKKLIIKMVEDIENLSFSHLIYISEGKSSSLSSVVRKIEGQPTLVVAERDGMVKRGAAISFLRLEGDVLRFELNKESLLAHNLKIDKGLAALSYKE